MVFPIPNFKVERNTPRNKSKRKTKEVLIPSRVRAKIKEPYTRVLPGSGCRMIKAQGIRIMSRV